MIRIFYILFLAIPLFATTLEELIVQANKHSTTLMQSKIEVDRAQIKVQESKAQQYGSLDFVGDYTHYNTPRTLAPLTPTLIGAGAPITTTQDLFSAGITYNIPLFTGFEHLQQIKIDDISSEISTIKLKLTTEQLVYNIRSLYLSILAQEEILKAQHTYTQTLYKLEEQISYEVKLGKKAKIDLYKAQADAHASLTQEEVLASTIEITKANLSSLVGKKIEEVIPLAIGMQKPHYSCDALYAGSENLSKIEIENMALSKTDRMIAKSKSSKFPQVHFSSYLGRNYGEDIASNNWDNETLWQVGVNVKWNLLDFGKRDLALQQANIEKMQASLRKEQTLLDLRKLLTQGVERIKQSYAEYLGNKVQLDLSTKSEIIEQVRYDNNVATLNDLLLASGKRQLAQAKLIESKYNYQKNVYYIDYLLEQGVKQ